MIIQRKYRALLMIFAVLANTGLFAQMPSADIYLCKINLSLKNIVSGNPLFLNGFNAGGYNNQPFFADYSNVFISSSKDNQPTDIYKLDLDKQEFFKFTATDKISEFSPRTGPDGRTLHVVRIEEDGKTQTLWAYPLERSGFGYNVIPALTNVGYYSFLSEEKVAMFLVDTMPKLAIADLKTGRVVTIQENIGRCLKEKNGTLYFTQKSPDGLHKVKKYDIVEQSMQQVFTLPTMVEDFEILNDGRIIFGQGGVLFLYSPEMPSSPREVANLSKFGIKNIKRIAVARDRLIFVEQKI